MSASDAHRPSQYLPVPYQYLIPVGFPASNATVPTLTKKPLHEVVVSL